MQSAKGICAYVYASAGVHESTTDTVFSGDAIIAENGRIFGRSERFSRDSSLIMADIDMNKLSHDRMLNSSFSDSMDTLPPEKKYTCISLDLELNWPDEKDRLHRYISPHPFVPSSKERRDIHCNEIFNIQTAALAKRLEHTGIRKVYIGISGGLDSTLALLAAHRTFKLLGFPAEDITGVTMPGFGTTERTNTNAKKLMKELNISSLEIDITRACLDHFKNIGHDPDIHDTTYENVQARERTQILMDLANKYNALVIGTGDLSELALGWCTYNGDHMSMYSINSGIPKTLVRHLIEWVAQAKESDNAEYILEDILATPISPELLPGSSEGKITQKTEDILGPYELHDFFLYYFLRQGAGPDKLKFLASHAFKDEYTEEEIQKWLKVFVSRFFSQQFKRSCIPDGPKVGSVSLSPRGDWKMPSDMSSVIWSENI
jgi:NAD+ synthase (glutamine-hydrolysing)